MTLPPDTIIKFGNAFHILRTHCERCTQCDDYLTTGEGELCQKAREFISNEMVFASTEPLELQEARQKEVRKMLPPFTRRFKS